ncbi:MAG: chromate transporter, partial [Candidatus Cloacimonadaceae bacterium]|nr:chromate transporter [Candidatus Cloacimonadaceae bacterium]
LKIFISFLKIGAFTIGGAYAMIPLIRREVVQRKQWMGDQDFLDGLAAAQSCPGPIAINISIYVGYHVKKTSGMLVAALGTLLPSLVVILVIASFFDRISELEAVRRIFHALKPAVTALIAVPVIQMSKSGGISVYNIWLPISAAIAVGILQINPIYLIVLTILGALLESYLKPRLRGQE